MTTTKATAHPYGPEWVARHEAAARRNAAISLNPGRSGNTGHRSARCLTPLVDGECVCR